MASDTPTGLVKNRGFIGSPVSVADEGLKICSGDGYLRGEIDADGRSCVNESPSLLRASNGQNRPRSAVSARRALGHCGNARRRPMPFVGSKFASDQD